MLHALGVERLWLFWRESPDGDLRALAAERRDDQVALTDLHGDPACWEPLLRAGASRVPALLEPTGEEIAALGGSGVLPPCVLRLPLEFRAALVGLILADVGEHRGAVETSFLDFAATLGNSAAMAIANARLYALVREHRAELQRLSNIVKHAAASRVDVRLTREPEVVLLEIEDDGRGFDAHAYFRTPSPSAGLGLVSMRERVAHFGGVLRVSSRPGSGTRILVRVPVEPFARTKAATAS